MLLGECRKNKIRLWDWQESTVCLRAFPAPQPSRTYRNFGLLNLVPRPLGIVFRIHKAGKPLLLVGLENVHPQYEEHRPYADGRHTHADPAPPPATAAETSHT